MPQPDGPIRQTNSPVRTSKLTSSSTATSVPEPVVNDFPTPRTESLTGRGAGSGTIESAREVVIAA